MKMTLKNRIVYNHIKRFYDKVNEVENTEEIYYKEGKLVVVIKDEELGNKIYEIVKELYDVDEEIYTYNMLLRISKYVCDKQNAIQMIYIDIKIDKPWWMFSEPERLNAWVELVKDMKEKGYILNPSEFKSKKCNSIANILSFFTLGIEEIEYNETEIACCVVKHIHYMLTKKDFSWDDIFPSNKNFLHVDELPYGLSILKLCCKCVNYEEITLQEISEAINNMYCTIGMNSLIVNRDLWESDLSDLHDIRIYGDSLEIHKRYGLTEEQVWKNFGSKYCNKTNEFKEFLKSYVLYSYKRKIKLVNEPQNLIWDVCGNIRGYKYETKAMEVDRIIDSTFPSQSSIISLIKEISQYINDATWGGNGKSLFDILSLKIQLIQDMDSYTNDVRVLDIEDLFEFANTDKQYLEEQLIKLFFEFYLKYVGKKSYKNEYLSTIDVKCLSPILAKEFIKYALGYKVDYEIATKGLLDFIHLTSRSTGKTGNEEKYYDDRLCYNPEDVPFIFDYELIDECGVEFEKGMNKWMPDGRRIITFNKSKDIFKFQKAEEQNINKVKKIKEQDYLYKEADSYVNPMSISKIIYRTDIQKDGMYKFAGFITKPIKNPELLSEKVTKLNNKDMLKVAANLITLFNSEYIPIEFIFMSNSFEFYIDIYNEKFDVKKMKEANMKWFINYILSNGGDKNSIISLAENDRVSVQQREYLLDKVKHLTNYCNKHFIYYWDNEDLCPICSKTSYCIPEDECFSNEAIKVFEDKYAIYYKYKEKNLKIYKAPYMNREEVIDERLQKENPIQACFIPYKKIVTKNSSKFMGYVYEEESIESEKFLDFTCENLTNLPRIKGLIRLILQVKQYLEEDLSFIEDPFTHVFLNKDYKEQVQILNIDLLSEKGSKKDTVKWTCDYIKSVILLDECIEIDIKDKNEDLDSLFKKLNNLSKHLTKKCKIHKIYYNDKQLFCPKCIPKNHNMKIELIDKSIITNCEEVGSGGESVIHEVDSVNKVAKVFKEDANVDLSLKCQLFYRIFSSKKEILEEINRKKELKYKYIIPETILADWDKHEVFGYTMKRVYDSMPISLLSDTSILKELGFTLKDVLEILITVGEGIETLHNKANIYIGDLNGGNILFDKDKNVYFLDFDGMGMDEIPTICFTEEYTDPRSIKGNITMEDDWYSYAVQAFLYLTLSHPFSGIYYDISESKQKKPLEIVEMMERRISILGEHEIEAPKITRDWKEWMTDSLKIAFLDIFENEKRMSIVPELIEQYKKLYCGEYADKEHYGEIRIAKNFTAKEITPFVGEVVAAINSYSAICENTNSYYIAVLVHEKEYNIQFPQCGTIRDILLSEENDIIYAIYNNKIVVVDLSTSKTYDNRVYTIDLRDTNTIIYTEEIDNIKNAILDENTLYYTANYNGEDIIFKSELKKEKSGIKVQKEEIRYEVGKETVGFLSKFNSKFVFVKRSKEEKIDEIYCNSEKFYDMTYNSEDVKYKILYDEATKTWLVINSQRSGIIIEKDGMYKEVLIDKQIDMQNIKNVIYRKRKIYIPNEDLLYIINTDDQSKNKKMECSEILNSNSKIYNINKRGFNVITLNRYYEVRQD